MATYEIAGHTVKITRREADGRWLYTARINGVKVFATSSEQGTLNAVAELAERGRRRHGFDLRYEYLSVLVRGLAAAAEADPLDRSQAVRDAYRAAAYEVREIAEERRMAALAEGIVL